MGLISKLTESFFRKQRMDQMEGWTWLERNMRNPGRTEIQQLTGTDANGQPTIDKSDPNYANWKDAHARATKRARQERKRREKEARPNKSPEVIRRCDINPETPVRDTLRVAILEQRTSRTEGSPLGKKRGQPIDTLIKEIAKKIKAVDDELLVRSRHRESHDLRLQNSPPARVFVAPEWFFRPPHSAYDTGERDQIIDEMTSLSRIYPDWLLVPGTIYWTNGNPATPPYDVFNTMVAYAGGTEVLRHNKANQHDIHGSLAWHTQNWGMYTGPNHTATNLNQPQAPASFLDQGLEWCIDICRDHFVGEGACGYAQHEPASSGADVYIVTANQTILSERFIAAKNGGFLIYCDGGEGHYYVRKVTRDASLALATRQLRDYYTQFWQERAHHSQSLQAAHRAEELLSDGHGATARAKVEELKDPANPDTYGFRNTVQTATAGIADEDRKKALEEHHWYHNAATQNPNVGGDPMFTNDEVAVMTQYAQLKQQEAVARNNFSTRNTAKLNVLQAIDTNTTITLDNIRAGTHVTVARPQRRIYIPKQLKGVRVYELIDI